MIIRACLCLCCCVCSAAMAEGIYRHVLPDGTVEYSDQPQVGAELLKPAPLSRFNTEPSRLAPETETSAKTPQESPEPYRQLEILEPEEEAVVWNDTGELLLRFRLEPELLSEHGHSLRLLHNGQQLEGRYLGQELRLNKLDRGQHTLQLEVVDREGKVLIRSNKRIVHFKQHSILHRK